MRAREYFALLYEDRSGTRASKPHARHLKPAHVDYGMISTTLIVKMSPDNSFFFRARRIL